jgi:two-component system, LytTR family, response regulator LytT
MMRCIAIDDEPLALKQLSGYIEKTPFLELAGTYDSAMKALGIVREGSIDLIYIDINMPDINGLDFVRSLDDPPMIVFVTAYSEYALEGFRVDAVDYLLKPIGYKDFLKSANKVNSWFESGKGTRRKSEKEEDFIFVKADYKILKISLGSIKYIESMSEYVRIHLTEGKPVMTLLSMKSLEEMLPSSIFMRVHRSYIVNLLLITVIDRGRIVFDGNVYIPVSEQYKPAFQSFLSKRFIS